jgi:[ribosomal protein S5]-alanine N-acetyltransferase
VRTVRFPLVGPRVELRPFAPSDAAAIHPVYSDERVMRWVGGGPVRRLEQTEELVRRYIDHQRRHGFSFWVVSERRSGELLGDAGLIERNGAIELGYTLGYDHWGKGYGGEAAALCVRAAFTALGAPEVVALVQPANERSVAVVAKLGFTPDGDDFAHGALHTVYRLTRDAFDHA